ncbi:hypothetical protein AKJ16_DCAP17225 [Drosera capensis]
MFLNRGIKESLVASFELRVVRPGFKNYWAERNHERVSVGGYPRHHSRTALTGPSKENEKGSLPSRFQCLFPHPGILETVTLYLPDASCVLCAEDNETVVSCPSPPCKSYNPFESDDDLLDCPESKAQNRLAKENSIGHGLEAFAPRVDFPWEGAILVHPSVVDSALRVDGSVDNGLFGKGMELYTNKNFMDCEMSELIVCYKESSYQSVKDICIDEGVPSQDKTWVVTKEEMKKEKDPSVLFDPSGNCNGDAKTLKASIESVFQLDSINNLSKMSEVSCNDELLSPVSPNQCFDEGSPNATDTSSRSAEEGSIPESCRVAGETKTDGHVNNATESSSLARNVSERSSPGSSDTEFMSGETLEDDPPGKELHEVPEKTASVESREIPTSVQESSSGKPDHLDETKAEFKSAENPGDNARRSTSSETSSSQYMAEGSAPIVSSSDTNADSGRVTIAINPVLPEEEKEIRAPSVDEIHPETQPMTRHAEGNSGNKAYVTLEQHFLGETSFNAEMPPPSSITYMGPVSYSGNISLRSESSAGSARSFAFPVLQTEWHGSPVRMVRADQRRLGKNRGWLQAVICCRF